jgi:hypothetical protein
MAENHNDNDLTLVFVASEEDKVLGVSPSTKAQVGLDDSIIHLLEDKRLLISPNDLILGKCIGQGIYTKI